VKTIKKLWLLIIILIGLTPLGLIIPAYFKAGSAWGEWSAEEMKNLVGYIPKGLARLASFWSAPLPDYAFKNCEGKPLHVAGIAYIISAGLGIAAVVGITFLVGRLLTKKGRD